MMKRYLSLALAVCLLAAGLWGCGKKDGKKDTSSAPVSSAVSLPTATPAPVQLKKVVRVKADDGLNIRSEPSTDADILGLAEYNSMLPLRKDTETDGWYEIEYEGKAAYVSAEYADVRNVTLTEYNKLVAGESGAGADISSSGAPIDDDPGKKPAAAASSASSGAPAAVSSSKPDTAKNSNDQDGE